MWSPRHALVPRLGRARVEGGRRAAQSPDERERDRAATFCRLFAAMAALALLGCKPSIGSGCTLSTDCSTQGDRVCDTAQPDGYCTVLNCTDNSCPNSAACVDFQVSVPGCAYSDYDAPARTSLVMCMKQCNEDSNCRQSDGYVCANPRGAPWYAAILDDNQNQSVCIAAFSSTGPSPSDTGVCALSLPPLPEAGPPADGGSDGSSGSAPEAGPAVGPSADAGADATLEGSGDAEVVPDATINQGDASDSAPDEDTASAADGE